ncbi:MULTISPECIES: hypothetical protein [Parafrankia]|uniref:hypothetical protein n=1 Tax=Parafrankia TaxID=2994362 RepID=UPI001D0169EA|nr:MULTISPECIES: hypothetical protein [Parafrankia]
MESTNSVAWEYQVSTSGASSPEAASVPPLPACFRAYSASMVTGQPVATSNATPSLAAVTSFERKDDARPDVVKDAPFSWPATSQRTR